MLWRDLACRRQAIQGNGEEAPAVRPRHSSSPPTDGALQWGAWDAIQYSNDRSSHDKEQRTGAVHHDGVSNTVCYLINVRDWLLTRHCLRKFSWCARDCHSLVASSIQTIGMRLISPRDPAQRRATPHLWRVALRAPRTRTLGRLLARRTRRTGDDVLIMQVLRREGRPCAGDAA